MKLSILFLLALAIFPNHLFAAEKVYPNFAISCRDIHLSASDKAQSKSLAFSPDAFAGYSHLGLQGEITVDLNPDAKKVILYTNKIEITEFGMIQGLLPLEVHYLSYGDYGMLDLKKGLSLVLFQSPPAKNGTRFLVHGIEIYFTPGNGKTEQIGRGEFTSPWSGKLYDIGCHLRKLVPLSVD